MLLNMDVNGLELVTSSNKRNIIIIFTRINECSAQTADTITITIIKHGIKKSRFIHCCHDIIYYTSSSKVSDILG